MRPYILVLTLILVYPALLSAQVPSEFYSVYGFRHPALRQGQYLLALTPHYFYNAVESSFSGVQRQGSLQGLEHMANPSGLSYFDFSANGILGITDNTSVGLSVSVLPGQQMLEHSYRYSFTAPSYAQSSGEVYKDSRNLLDAEVTLAVRPRPNIEVAFLGRYLNLDMPTDLQGNYYLNTSSASSSIARTTSISANTTIYEFSVTFTMVGP